MQLGRANIIGKHHDRKIIGTTLLKTAATEHSLDWIRSNMVSDAERLHIPTNPYHLNIRAESAGFAESNSDLQYYVPPISAKALSVGGNYFSVILVIYLEVLKINKRMYVKTNHGKSKNVLTVNNLGVNTQFFEGT